MTAGCNVYA